MIIFFHLFNLFQASFIIPLSYNGIQQSSIIHFIKDEIKVNLKSMQITVIFENFYSNIIQLIKTF